MNIYKHLDTRIVSNLTYISKNNKSLNLYFELIEKNLLNPPINSKLIEKHHILPKSLFPQYKKLNQNKWNEVILTSWDHFEAHRLLMNITEHEKMYEAYSMMSQNGRWNNYLDMDQKKDYEKAREEHKKILKKSSIFKDKNGNMMRVKLDDPRIKSGLLIGSTTGKFIVKDENGKCYSVRKNDPRYISGELKSINSKKVMVKNNKNNTLVIDLDDPRYISGELKPINLNKIIVKDENGKNIQIDKNDPNYISGKYQHVNKNKIMARDLNGNTLQINKDDPRFKTGEISGITKGMKKYTNGIINKTFFPGTEPEGFYLGSLRKKKK